MFDRFTHETRKALASARNSSQDYNMDFVGMANIVIGLLQDPALSEKFDFDRIQCIEDLRGTLSPYKMDNPPVSSKLPFSQAAKQTLEQAYQYALESAHGKSAIPEVTPLHLLYGAMKTEPNPETAPVLDVLGKYGINSDTIHEIVSGTATKNFRGFDSIDDFAAAICDGEADRITVQNLDHEQQKTLIGLINKRRHTESGAQPYKVETEKIFPGSGDPHYNLVIYFGRGKESQE